MSVLCPVAPYFKRGRSQEFLSCLGVQVIRFAVYFCCYNWSCRKPHNNKDEALHASEVSRRICENLMCQSCGWGSGPLDSLFRTSESELQTHLRFVYKPGCITRTSCLLHKVVVARRMCVVVSLTWLIDTGRVTIDNIVSRPTCMFVLSVLAILPQTCCDHTCILRVKMPKNPLAGILWSPDQT